jgi:nucleotide-binding universal stress UspA family protein
MKRATSVVLLHVGEDGADEKSMSDAEAFVVRHGIAVVTDNRPRTETTVAGDILRIAGGIGADLIVTGAYGHTRLREWVFGGVTRGLLAACQIPHLSSH